MGITIVGLGPGDGRFLTREAWELLSQTPALIVRTRLHPAVADLPAHCAVESFDALYEATADFESVYRQIVETVVARGRTDSPVYAVPGSPGVGEATVAGIVERARAEGVPVRIVEGLSFVEPTLTALGRDALDGLQLFDAITLARYLHPPVNPDAPLLLGQLYSPWLASELKLTLMALYPAEHAVQLVHDAGTPQQRVETLPLHAVDRSAHIRNLTALFVPPRATTSSLGGFAETIAVLRSPHGCPWDREQTPQSLRDSLLEEAAELLDALDHDDPAAVCEELGDLLLHIVMQAQMAAEAGDFTISDVVAAIDAKIRRRHPHVWGDQTVADTAELRQLWAQLKAREKQGRVQDGPASLLDNLPIALPALARSQKIQRRVARVGFDWPTLDGVWDKVHEELEELRTAVTDAERTAELGDLLFALVNLARRLQIDAEIALREANLRFMHRFAQVEQRVWAQGKTLADCDLDSLDALWRAVKADEQLR